MNALPIEFHYRSWPEEIMVEPARLSVGLWGESEGDIAAAYCADTLPKAKIFTHDGQLFTNTGQSVGTGQESVDGYPLIPAKEYCGPEPRPYTYEGKPARHEGKIFGLAAKCCSFAGKGPPKNGLTCFAANMLTADILRAAHTPKCWQILGNLHSNPRTRGQPSKPNPIAPTCRAPRKKCLRALPQKWRILPLPKWNWILDYEPNSADYPASNCQQSES